MPVYNLKYKTNIEKQLVFQYFDLQLLQKVCFLFVLKSYFQSYIRLFTTKIGQKRCNFKNLEEILKT